LYANLLASCKVSGRVDWQRGDNLTTSELLSRIGEDGTDGWMTVNARANLHAWGLRLALSFENAFDVLY